MTVGGLTPSHGLLQGVEGWRHILILNILSEKTRGWSGNFNLSFATATNIAIGAKGLKPNSVYTTWFVNTKPKKHEIGAGQTPFMFKTDSDGNGTYFASLDISPFGKWQMLMVVLHPNGDPKDMKNMVGALSAKLVH